MTEVRKACCKRRPVIEDILVVCRAIINRFFIDFVLFPELEDLLLLGCEIDFVVHRFKHSCSPCFPEKEKYGHSSICTKKEGCPTSLLTYSNALFHLRATSSKEEGRF